MARYTAKPKATGQARMITKCSIRGATLDAVGKGRGRFRWLVWCGAARRSGVHLRIFDFDPSLERPGHEFTQVARTIQASTGRIWIESLRKPFDVPIDGTVDQLPHIGGDPCKPTGIGQIVEAHISLRSIKNADVPIIRLGDRNPSCCVSRHKKAHFSPGRVSQHTPRAHKGP
jgi:hypothetical protein